MTMHNLSRLGLSLMLTASLGACSQQSTYHRPDLDVAPAWQQESRGLTAQQAGPWWQGFQDPALDRLVEAVLAANPDMRVAGLKLKNALLGADLADTNLTPSVSANLGASGTKNMKDGSASSNLGPSLNLSYEVDLWGRLAAARDQASWEAQASEQDLAATRLLLIGKTLEQYWQLAYLGSAITLGTQQLANLERIERLTRAKYEAGAVTRLDLVQASQQKAGKQAELATFMLLPANLLPITHFYNKGLLQSDTIFSGIMMLYRSKMSGIATIVLSASILVPVGKILGLGWICWQLQRAKPVRRKRQLVMYRVIDFIGRWSMLDLFVISLMVALVDRGVLLSVRAGPGATAFAGVVVLTMMSARMLDTRLLWDKAAR